MLPTVRTLKFESFQLTPNSREAEPTAGQRFSGDASACAKFEAIGGWVIEQVQEESFVCRQLSLGADECSVGDQ